MDSWQWAIGGGQWADGRKQVARKKGASASYVLFSGFALRCATLRVSGITTRSVMQSTVSRTLSTNLSQENSKLRARNSEGTNAPNSALDSNLSIASMSESCCCCSHGASAPSLFPFQVRHQSRLAVAQASSGKFVRSCP